MRFLHLSIIMVLAALLAVATLQLASSLLPAQQIGGAAAQRQCAGISTSILRTQNPVITRIYRVFADGVVETYDDGAPGAKWTVLK